MGLKTDKEIDVLRTCADIVSRTLAEVARFVEPGITTAQLDREAERYVRAQGAEPAFKGYRVGSLPPFPGTLCVSVNDAVVHGMPGSYALQAGDVVSIDCGVCFQGYFGDSAFTFAVGDIAADDARLCRTTFESLQKGVAQARPGQRLGDVSSAVQRHCEARGYGVVRELVGHGIGRALHEDPQVPNVGQPHSGRKLRTGLVFCLEPMINRGTYRIVTDRDKWTVRTADGATSAHYEHMVAVGRQGPEVLTTFDYIEDVSLPPYSIAEPTYG